MRHFSTPSGYKIALLVVAKAFNPEYSGSSLGLLFKLTHEEAGGLNTEGVCNSIDFLSRMKKVERHICKVPQRACQKIKTVVGGSMEYINDII